MSAGRTRPGTARARRVAAIVLAIGWTAAAVVWATATPVDQDDEVYEVEHSKRVNRDLERLGGRAALLGRDLDDALARLWEGPTRAVTIAVLTAAAAGAVLLLERAARAHDEA